MGFCIASRLVQGYTGTRVQVYRCTGVVLGFSTGVVQDYNRPGAV
jgi:hypothetical protein